MKQIAKVILNVPRYRVPSGAAIALISLLSLVGYPAAAHLSQPATGLPKEEITPTSETAPPVTTTSGESELALVEHLTAIGAIFYGAWWCPHCYDQKQLFGKSAAEQLPYVECYPDGQMEMADVCVSADVLGFPTWVINGQVYNGTQTLDELADASDYQGPRDFQNSL